MKLDLSVSRASFLKNYWQKKPLYIKAAFKAFATGTPAPLTPNDLAYLATRPDSLARLVSGAQARDFKVEHGPFTAQRFAKLPKKNWTLLVQDVDKFDDDVHALLALFDFLPQWRIEDIMVSYAVTGGSVGAHVDQYDVFLLQVAGHRRWQIDSSANPPTAFIKNAKLKLLESFHPDHDQVLAPGDMLYLPPGVPHHGVAVDNDCMTFSIGLRAPSISELLANLAQQHGAFEHLRLADPDLSLPKFPERIELSQLKHVRQALQQAIAMDDLALSEWFGRFISSYRSVNLSADAPRARTNKKLQLADVGQKLTQGWGLVKPRQLRAALRFDGQVLYVAGLVFPVTPELAELLFSASACIDGIAFAKLAQPEQVLALLHHGVLRWQRL